MPSAVSRRSVAARERACADTGRASRASRYAQRLTMKAGPELRRVIRRYRSISSERGVAEVVRKGAAKTYVYASYPIHRRLHRSRMFTFQERRYACFVHHYNATWRNERTVEIPLAMDFLKRTTGGDGLEVGNVLSYYCDVHHLVVDKYEQARGVLNVDVMVYEPLEPLDFIVSISTLEHVGWDEEPRDPHKAVAALVRLRTFLKPTGRMFVTVPLGHNPYLDASILDGSLSPLREGFLGWAMRDEWLELARREAGEVRGDARFTKVVWIAEFDRPAPRRPTNEART
jgi:hypothetical protein